MIKRKLKKYKFLIFIIIIHFYLRITIHFTFFWPHFYLEQAQTSGLYWFLSALVGQKSY